MCIPACAEGAIQIIDGKAKLVKDIYCDGLGACLGKCPKDAMTIIKREAKEFDEKAAEEHAKKIQSEKKFDSNSSSSCPSVQIQNITKQEKTIQPSIKEKKSSLSTWPVQLKLLPPNASFLQNADLLIAADCVPFAYAKFHQDYLKNRILAVGCPKLDDTNLYKNKLAAIFRTANIKTVTVVNMEVPCCFGLSHLVNEAMELSGKKIPVKQETINIKGEKK